MKKICIITLILFVVSFFVSACTTSQQKASMIQAKRRFAEYVEPQQKTGNVVDLSEGPKLRYEADFGPKNLNFDIKVVDPY